MLAVLFVWLGLQGAPAADSTWAALDRAYAELKVRNYDQAIAQFREAARLAPGRASIRKDLAYALLKTGDNASARDEFHEAMMLEPGDIQVAMEYAYLCYETGEKTGARRAFDRLRHVAGPHQADAERAFENIDRPLAEGIERWTAALTRSDSASAHEELAKLAEERDELPLAAEHYAKAWKLRPGWRMLLLDLGRVDKELGRQEEANLALLAASRGPEARVAERARALLPARYPYVYEFQKALVLDPGNIELRRELAYLHLAMAQRDEAEAEFERVVRDAPGDLLSAAQLGFLRLAKNDKATAMPLLERVLAGDDDELADRVRVALRLPQTLKRHSDTPRSAVSVEAKTLAQRSLDKGYLQDALKYLKIAHENDPVDFRVMLQLGWANNAVHQDGEAIRWFGLARRSPESAVATEAARAYNNLRPQFARFRTTTWFFPFYSSRWKDVFAYGQSKTEMTLPSLPLRAYVSVRFIGDTRGAATINPTMSPQFLSESSVILAAGLATPVRHGAFAWFEAGEAFEYRHAADPRRGRTMTPDYRGGVSFNKGFGQMLAHGSHGLFAETNNDAVFVNRFNNDVLIYSQNRTGYTFAGSENSGFQAQAFVNWNLTTDVQHQQWANFAESGPGVRARFPRGFLLTAGLFRGVYTVPQHDLRRPNYWDLRVGIWYAFTATH